MSYERCGVGCIIAVMALGLFFWEDPTLAPPTMAATKKVFGTLSDGRVVNAFTLSSGLVTATFVEYGATLISFLAPDRNGNAQEITVCHATLEELQHGLPQCYYGATVGRVGNRIKNGQFKLPNDTTSYALPTNNGPNCLHGGNVGFDKRLWTGEILDNQNSVKFSLVSQDGDQGFPGQVAASITYSLTEGKTLRLEYEATSTKPTPLALTNHTYWNLSGNSSQNILEHKLTMPATTYLPVDATSIPVGTATVENTPFDFRATHTLGERIADIGGDPGGYDHCYVNVNVDASSESGSSGEARTTVMDVATVECTASGRTMHVASDQPGVQLYTGNYMDGEGAHSKHGGLCLETQAFPDAINQWPDQVVLLPNQTWTSTTVHTFGVV